MSAIEFNEWLFEQGRAAVTIRGYAADLAAFGVWFEQTNGEPFLGSFTPTDVREYRGHLLTVARAAPATVNRRLAALRAYGAFLVALGNLEHNPAAQARGVKEQAAAPRWLDRKEQARLTRELERELAAATASTSANREARRNLAIVTLLLHSGLRVAELCALSIGDITIGERSGHAVVRQGKGGKARTVPLNLEARRALSALLVWRCGHWGNADAVFLGRRGERLSARGVQKMLAEVGRRAGVEVTPHALRHTFAKNLINAGVSLEKIAPLLGHSSLSTTAIYTTPSAAELARAVEVLED